MPLIFSFKSTNSQGPSERYLRALRRCKLEARPEITKRKGHNDVVRGGQSVCGPIHHKREEETQCQVQDEGTLNCVLGDEELLEGMSMEIMNEEM